MIAGGVSFSSGILLFTDTEPIVPRRIPHQSRSIFHSEFHSHLGSAHSIFVIGESVDWEPAAFQRCEHALDGVPSAERTIERMRETIEQSLSDDNHDQRDRHPAGRERVFIVALYSSCQGRYSLFRAINTTLREVVGYDCQGTGAYLGHYLIRDRYIAARSLNELNLTTVFSIAVDALAGIREAHEECGASNEMIVVYANGRVSAVQLMPQDSPRHRAVTLTRLTGYRRTPTSDTRAIIPNPAFDHDV
ncbi:MAG TPA: hypothetical protein VGF24_22440 [Vicinamibacterales bacterium]|jgi:hypothetical protein